MSIRYDLSGMIFGRWLVVSFHHKDVFGQSCWLCECNCQNKTQKIISSGNLKRGISQSCGCYKSERIRETQFENLINKKYNEWFVFDYGGKNKSGNAMWWCRCSCGDKIERRVSSSDLKSGKSRSCGCLQKKSIVEQNKKRIGINNPNYRDGKSNEPYPKYWNNELRESIRNRDQRRCQYPECQYDDTREKTKLSIHHINSNKQCCNDWNLVSLCRKHHRKIEFDPISWQTYFYEITGDYI